MEKPMISVIVPIYNAEKYLHYCLDSIKAQTYQDYEVLMVNDGSTDSSADICKKYQNEDGRFKLIMQANAGPSIARNTGIDAAKGEYVFFIDSDDYIHCQTFELMMSAATEEPDSDIVFAKGMLSKDYSDLKENLKEGYKVIYRDDLIRGVADNMEMVTFWPVWNKLYKKTVIGTERLSNSTTEDREFNIRVYLQSNKACLLNAVTYQWIQRKSSLSHINYNRTFNEMSDLPKLYKLLPSDNELYKSWFLYCTYRAVVALLYHHRNTKHRKTIENIANNIDAAMWTDFKSNKNISFAKKLPVYIFKKIPLLYGMYFSVVNHHGYINGLKK